MDTGTERAGTTTARTGLDAVSRVGNVKRPPSPAADDVVRLPCPRTKRNRRVVRDKKTFARRRGVSVGSERRGNADTTRVPLPIVSSSYAPRGLPVGRFTVSVHEKYTCKRKRNKVPVSRTGVVAIGRNTISNKTARGRRARTANIQRRTARRDDVPYDATSRSRIRFGLVSRGRVTLPSFLGGRTSDRPTPPGRTSLRRRCQCDRVDIAVSYRYRHVAVRRRGRVGRRISAAAREDETMLPADPGRPQTCRVLTVRRVTQTTRRKRPTTTTTFLLHLFYPSFPDDVRPRSPFFPIRRVFSSVTLFYY